MEVFYALTRRFEQLAGCGRNPPLGGLAWKLLDAVRRRINRRLLRPEEEARGLKKNRFMSGSRKKKSRFYKKAGPLILISPGQWW